MTTKERAPLGFGDELDNFDPTTWSNLKPATDKLKPAETKKAAEAAGFRSREPAKAEAPKAPAVQRRRRTGRNAQFNIKTKQEVINAFVAIADAQGWGLGETFEFATDLLTKACKSGTKACKSGSGER